MACPVLPVPSAAAAPSSLSAEVRITAFTPQGRWRGHGALLLQRPASFRLDVYGPHGGVVFSAASDGRVLQALDLMHNVSRCQELSPAALEGLIGMPQGRDGAAFVALLSGELALPAGAACRAMDGKLQASWQAEGFAHVALFATPQQGQRLRAYSVRDAAGRGVSLSLEPPYTAGLPAHIHIHIQRLGEAPQSELELRLHDVQAPADCRPGDFTLPRPPGMARQSFSAAGAL